MAERKQVSADFSHRLGQEDPESRSQPEKRRDKTPCWPYQSLILCRCALYRRVDKEKLAKIAELAAASGIPCRVTDDLCGEAAQDPKRLADADAVVGCRRRALDALLNFAGVKNFQAFSVDEWTEIFQIDNDSPKVNSDKSAFNGEFDRMLSDVASNDWAAWFPVIDAGRCVACKKCVDFCLFGVYAVRDKTVRVEKPDHCKTDCPACARICPANAIIFPKSPEASLNGSLEEVVRPSAEGKRSFAERLRQRGKRLPLFKEDEE